MPGVGRSLEVRPSGLVVEFSRQLHSLYIHSAITVTACSLVSVCVCGCACECACVCEYVPMRVVPGHIVFKIHFGAGHLALTVRVQCWVLGDGPVAECLSSDAHRK